MNWYKTFKAVKHHYSWVYVNLPKDICSLMKEFGKEIDPEDLFVGEGDGGLEMDFHITVKYGLLNNETKEVKDCIDGLKGGKAYLGSSSIFEGGEYDVVKITVESEVLDKLHASLNQLPHEDKHAEYQPHATIAYVKSGCGKKYVGKFKLNKSFRFKEVFFDDQKKDHKIRLACGNWYKASQIVEGDEYYEIAHPFPIGDLESNTRNRRDKTGIDGLYLWVYKDGHLESVPLAYTKQTHGEVWENISKIPFSGRFDSKTNQASIVSGNSFRKIPSVVETAIRNEFGQDIEILRYSI